MKLQRKSGADLYFIMHLTIAVSLVLLWAAYFLTIPDFASGLAAGMLLASAVVLFWNRGHDEYTLAIWHAGASAAFMTLVTWLVVKIFLDRILEPISCGGQFPALLAITVYLVAVAIKHLGWRR